MLSSSGGLGGECYTARGGLLGSVNDLLRHLALVWKQPAHSVHTHSRRQRWKLFGCCDPVVLLVLLPPLHFPSQGHGIIGCFRFTDSYYLLVVARREYVGHICGACDDKTCCSKQTTGRGPVHCVQCCTSALLLCHPFHKQQHLFLLRQALQEAWDYGLMQHRALPDTPRLHSLPNFILSASYPPHPLLVHLNHTQATRCTALLRPA